MRNRVYNAFFKLRYAISLHEDLIHPGSWNTHRSWRNTTLDFPVAAAHRMKHFNASWMKAHRSFLFAFPLIYWRITESSCWRTAFHFQARYLHFTVFRGISNLGEQARKTVPKIAYKLGTFNKKQHITLTSVAVITERYRQRLANLQILGYRFRHSNESIALHLTPQKSAAAMAFFNNSNDRERHAVKPGWITLLD